MSERDQDTLSDRVGALETEIGKLKQENESLKARVEVLEASDGGGTERKATKQTKHHAAAKPTSGSKKKKKEKKEKKKKPSKLKSEDQPKKKRGRTKTDFYQFCGKKLYVDVPAPFEFGTKRGNPAKVLELEYSYGFNGIISQNLITLEENKELGQTTPELCYNLAGVSVIINPENLSEQRFFMGHCEDVVSIAKNPCFPLIATGQRDPKDGTSKEDHPYVSIWNSHTMHEVARIREYCARCCCSLGYTGDGKYLFVIGQDDSNTGGLFDMTKVNNNADDEKGLIKMVGAKSAVLEHMTSKDTIHGQSHCPIKDGEAYQWLTFGEKTLKWWSYDPTVEDKTERLKIITPNSFSVTKISQKAFYCASWTSAGDALVGTHSGHIYVFKTGTHKLIKFWDTGKYPIKSITPCTVDDTEGYRAFDSKGTAYYYNSSHKQSGEPIAFKQPGTSCAVDLAGKLYVGTSNCNLSEYSVPNDPESKRIITQGHTKEIWCLATSPTDPYLCIGSDDKRMRVWDYIKKEVVFFKKCKHGYRSGDFSRDGSLLAVGCTDGTLVVISVSAPEEGFIYEHKICKEEISAVAFSKDGTKIIVGSWDQTLRIVNLSKDGTSWSLGKKALKGHTSSITHICMSEDGSVAQSNSKDCEILYWDIKGKCRIDDVPSTTIWDRWNCILGWPVQGLFHEAGDPTDVNCCEISGGNEIDDEGGNKMVASGDDEGHVSLFKYPVLETKPKANKYLAHSAHVTNVRFTEDDSYLFSAGGGDLAVFQWKIKDRD